MTKAEAVMDSLYVLQVGDIVTIDGGMAGRWRIRDKRPLPTAGPRVYVVELKAIAPDRGVLAGDIVSRFDWEVTLAV